MKVARNYRPVTLMDTGYKVDAEVLRVRMAKKFEREGKLGETQMWFREGRGTIDSIYLLNTVIRKNLGKGKRRMAIESGMAYVYFADL